MRGVPSSRSIPRDLAAQMPRAERAARRRRMRTPRTASAATSAALKRETSRRGRGIAVPLDASVAQLDAAIHRCRELGIVGHDRDGGAIAVEIPEQRDDL